MFNSVYNEALLIELKTLDDILKYLSEFKNEGVEISQLLRRFYNVSLLPKGKTEFENVNDFIKNANFNETNNQVEERIKDSIKYLEHSGYISFSSNRIYIKYEGILKIHDGFSNSYKKEVDYKAFQKSMTCIMTILTFFIAVGTIISAGYYINEMYKKPIPTVCNSCRNLLSSH